MLPSRLNYRTLSMICGRGLNHADMNARGPMRVLGVAGTGKNDASTPQSSPIGALVTVVFIRDQSFSDKVTISLTQAEQTGW